MTNAARKQPHRPHGIDLLPRDLTPAELADVPVLASVDDLLIDDVTDDEDDAFAAALSK